MVEPETAEASASGQLKGARRGGNAPGCPQEAWEGPASVTVDLAGLQGRGSADWLDHSPLMLVLSDFRRSAEATTFFLGGGPGLGPFTGWQ